MYQVPQEIWNQIAHEGNLKTKWAAKMFNLTEEERNKELEKEQKAMEKKGTDSSVIIAYQRAMPLMAENRAIADYMIRNQNPEMRSALPELLNPREAVIVMRLEYNLSDSQSGDLYSLLSQKFEPMK